MELIVITVLAALLPVMSILSFIVGWNLGSPRRITLPKKTEERKPTEDEIMLERIDSARVFAPTEEKPLRTADAELIERINNARI